MTGQESELQIQQARDVRVININGGLIDRLGVEKVSDQISDNLAKTQAPKVVICFDKINEVSSAILGAVLKIDKQVRAGNGHLRLSGMQPNVKEVFRITRLDTILDIHVNSTEAVEHFE